MKIDTAGLLTALDERRHALGELRSGSAEPLTWVEVAGQVGTHSATFSRLKAGRAPGQATYQRLMSWLGMDAGEFCSGCNAEAGQCEDCQNGQGPDVAGPDGDVFALAGDTDLPVADRGREWDGDAARTRVFEAYADDDGNVDVEQVSRAFLWRDDDTDPQTQAAWKLGYADIIDGTLTIVPAGVFATAGGRGVDAVDAVDGISDEDRDRVKANICKLYNRLADELDDVPECPFSDDDSDDGADDSDDAADSQNAGNGDEAARTGDDTDDSDMDAVAAIYGWGSLSDTADPDTAAKVTRVAELLREGAVGVSIMHDLNPDDMPSQAEIDALIEAEDWEALDELFANISARPRHVAIVDVPAFSDARLTLGDDGLSVEGPVTFEGTWTGDVRRLPYGVLTWDDDLLPIPIVIDHDGGSNEVVGYINRLERRDGVTSAMHGPDASEAQVAAVTASVTTGALPAAYFEVDPRDDGPLRLDAPDANGLRRLHGLAAPRGVCHRSNYGGPDACFQYPGEVDERLPGLMTGAPVELDSGETLRPAALTFKGRHLDTSLQQQGVRWDEANRHRDDANTIFAIGRAKPTPHGLGFSGVMIPDMTDADILRAFGSAPSVEMWGKGSGRTSIGIHLVPTPAWPVAASAGGSAIEFSSGRQVEPGEGVSVSDFREDFGTQELDVPHPDLAQVTESLARVEKALALLVADRLTDVPLTDDIADETDSANATDSANSPADSANESGDETANIA